MWPDQIFPTIKFAFSLDGPFGLRGGGKGGGGGGLGTVQCTGSGRDGHADATEQAPPERHSCRPAM